MTKRDEIAAHLHGLQDAIQHLARKVDGGLRELPNVKTENLPRFLNDHRRLLVAWQQEQLKAWDTFVAAVGLQVI